jgi:hypothetical protein
VEAANTTNRLQPGGELRSENVEHSTDLGTVLASGDDELRLDQEQYALVDSGFDDASTGEQAEKVDAAYDRLKERTDGLKTREEEAVEEHAADELETVEFLQVLLWNYNEASTLLDSLDELRSKAADVQGYSISNEETDGTEEVFETHHTQIRADVDSTFDPTERTTLLVQTAETGYSLSSIDDRQYSVETSRFDNRDRDGLDEDLGPSDALSQTRELHPWASGSVQFSDLSSENLYRLEIAHTQGTLRAYVDGGTASVYRENQQLSLNNLPSDNETTWSNDDIGLTVAQTPGSGPAEVTTTDSDGGVLNATVSIDGTDVGETGEDGSLWILPPLSEYTVEAATDESQHEVSLGTEQATPQADDDDDDAVDT